jgi:tripartite motif-containing protein 71
MCACIPVRPPAVVRLVLAVSALASLGSANAGTGLVYQDSWYTTSWAIASGADGTLLLANSHDGSITRCTTEGQILHRWGTSGSLPGSHVGPLGVTVDGLGRVLVTDFYTNRIQVYNDQGILLMLWNSTSTPSISLNRPKAIAAHADLIAVADFTNNQVQIRTVGGDSVISFGQSILLNPMGIDFGPTGDVYVTDRRDRVVQFSASGQLIRTWGSFGTSVGRFDNPVAVTVGSETVYVVDRLNHRVQMFSLDGQFIAALGSRGSGEGQFHYPTDATVTPDNILFVLDGRNHRVQVFAAPVESGTRLVSASWSSIKSRVWK